MFNQAGTTVLTHPISQFELTKNKKIHYQAMKNYYEEKLRFLEERYRHKDDPQLLRMACWDAPVSVVDLSKGLMRRLFKWQARRFYQRRLQDAERRLKRLNS